MTVVNMQGESIIGNKEVIEALESALARARAGHIVAFALVESDANGQTASDFRLPLHGVAIVGSLELLKHRILHG